MSRFAAEVSRVEHGSRVVLFHGQTGRQISLSQESIDELESWDEALPPPPTLRALASRLEGLHMLRESQPPQREELIPARSRRALLLPRTSILWHPLPWGSETTLRFGEMELSSTEIQIWRACNGARTVQEIAQHCQISTAKILLLFDRLTSIDVQALQLRSAPIRRHDPSLSQLLRPTSMPPDIDESGCSVAHIFSLPHPGLDGEPYGARLHWALENRRLLPDEGDTLEIGSGSSRLIESWLRRTAERGSPQGELVQLHDPEQPEESVSPLPGVRRLEGSASAIPLAEGSLSLVLCTEVMSSLSAVPFDATTTANPTLSQGLAPAVAQAIERYDLTHLPGRAWYNLGAWRLIEQMARVLKPGGLAVLTDRGEIDQSPVSRDQHDHAEVSIHFGHLVQVAEALGLEARSIPLTELLDVQLQSHWLSRASFQALAARLRTEGQTLEPLAWTEEGLELPWPVEGLHWVSLSEDGPGPLITRYRALLLQKPS
jgi:SAM-dependent methyltransferase